MGDKKQDEEITSIKKISIQKIFEKTNHFQKAVLRKTFFKSFASLGLSLEASGNKITKIASSFKLCQKKP